MTVGDQDRAGELRISLEQLLIVQDTEAADDYRDNYVRRMGGPILLGSGEPGTEVKIGGVLDRDIVDEPLSDDLLAVTAVTILPEYGDKNCDSQEVRKIVEPLGYLCGAVVMRPENRTAAAPEIVAEEEPAYGAPIELQPTNDPSILLVVSY